LGSLGPQQVESEGVTNKGSSPKRAGTKIKEMMGKLKVKDEED